MPKPILIGVVVCAIFGVCVFWFAKERTLPSLLQLLGAGFLIIVVFTHFAEAFHLFASMGWGLPNSLGHYIDLTSAVAGLVLLPAGYLGRRLARRTNSN